MRRRRYLRIGGVSLAGLAGCLSFEPPAGTDGDDSDSPDDADASPTPTTAATESPSLTATATSLQPGVVAMTTADSIGTLSDDGSQYLYVRVSVESGDAPAPADLGLHFDGDRSPPADERRLWRNYNDEEGRYAASSGEGWLLFELPAAGDPDDLALTWDGGEVTVEDDVAGSLSARLANPAPPLTLEVDAPESLERGQTPEVEFSVANEGPRTARFVAGLNRTGPSIAYAPIEAVSRPIPADATETWRVRDTSRIGNPGLDDLGDGEPDMTYRVHWLGGSRTARVRLLAHGRA